MRHVNAQDYAAVEAMDVEETLYDVDDIFTAAITLREREGLFHLEFESASSLEVEVLVAFFHFLGATGIEISALPSPTSTVSRTRTPRSYRCPARYSHQDSGQVATDHHRCVRDGPGFWQGNSPWAWQRLA